MVRQRSFRFKIVHEDANSRARAAELVTAHGTIPTPVFIPVGTHGAVKALSPKELVDLRVHLVLANTYHLHLSPGSELIGKAGGLHRFMNWRGPLLTDSGGFQVFSLQKDAITEEGALFQGPQNRKVLISPEISIQVQQALGSDIMMAFDECLPYPSDRATVRASIGRTHRWLDRCIKSWTNPHQALFGIIQGGQYESYRQESAAEVTGRGLPGYAIGGVSVGEGPEVMERVVAHTAPLMPGDKPRYVMGVGNPEDLLMIWEHGIDMSDCIIPTKFARGGTLFTNRGKIRIRHKNYRRDFFPVEPNCPCYTCRNFTRSYLKHLFDANEILGQILATIHNVAFYQSLAKRAREAILADRFIPFKKAFLESYTNPKKK